MLRLARLTCAPCWRDDEEMKMAVMKVLHQIHPDMGVDRGGMNAVLDFLNSSLHRIVANADTARETLASSSLADTSDVPGHWFTARHFAIAVCQQLPDELVKHSMSEGTKAVCKFRNSSGTAALEIADLADLETKRLDLSTYAGLQFSVNAMGVSLARYAPLFSSDAPVFLAAVIEYLAAEVLELSGNLVLKDHREEQIRAHHVKQSISDEERLKMRGPETEAEMAGTYGAISEMGAVEVLEPHDRAYFTAYMVDIQEGGKKTLVRYQNETEPTWVDSARVRARPPPMSPQEMATYDPPEGERVEVLFEEEQESWWEGEVRTKKGGFFVIAFPDEGDSVSTVSAAVVDGVRRAAPLCGGARAASRFWRRLCGA